MNSQEFKKLEMSDKSGVYFWKKGEKILYIGKATSLRDRVKSYFSKDLINTRGPAILDMVTQTDKIEWQETDSVLEALILEANLIKKHQPKYNTKEKDNKSFNYVCITREELPKILIVRGRNLNKEKYDSVFGPFPNGSQLKEAMKIIRRIFPYLDNDSEKKNNREFYRQLGLIPDIKIASYKYSNSSRSPSSVPYADKNFNISIPQSYKNNIKNLKLFFQGKKKSILVNLKKEMAAFSKLKDFENAARIRNQIFALNHINDVALIKDDFSSIDASQKASFLQVQGPGRTRGQTSSEKNFSASHLFRIEAYDIAHMSGKDMVGVMVVVEDGEIEKGEYKKFIIKTQSGANDTGALEEVLSRRLRHTEWGLPNIIVVDGGKAQINVAKRVINRYQFLEIPIVSVLKDERHKAKAIIGDEKIIKKYQKEILLANSESHRFAIAFHKLKRNKSFLNK